MPPVYPEIVDIATIMPYDVHIVAIATCAGAIIGGVAMT
jgi:hypothetical protein